MDETSLRTVREQAIDSVREMTDKLNVFATTIASMTREMERLCSAVQECGGWECDNCGRWMPPGEEWKNVISFDMVGIIEGSASAEERRFCSNCVKDPAWAIKEMLTCAEELDKK